MSINRGRFGLRSAIILPILLACLGAQVLATPGPWVRDRLLVKARSGVTEQEIQQTFAAEGARQADTLHQINVRILRVAPERLTTVHERLNRHPHIEFAEPDFVLEPALIPNDFYYSYQWHLPKIQAPSVWDSTVGSSAVVIAVLDSGVEWTHPDLAPNLVPGWNVVDNTSNTEDVTGHGTFVAGTAAAVGQNSIGVASVAWGCRVMPIRVTDTNGYTSSSLLASALTYAADRGLKIANISFRTTGSSLTLSNAAQYFQSKGGIVVAAAGNEGVYDSRPEDPTLLIVGATDANDNLASFSNRGAFVDLVAPGVSIATTGKYGSSGQASGTSLSAPIVAGVIALMLSANPALTPAQVEQAVEASADDLGTAGRDSSFGWGRVNASKAVQMALTITGGDTVAPVASVLSPGTGSTVSGTVDVKVGATDNQAVARVDAYANGVFIGSCLSGSGSVSWDTSKCGNGSYNLHACAYDTAGNAGSSLPVAVSVQNPVPDTVAPSVSITSPASGATVSGVTSVSIAASDSGGITKVEFLVAGVVIGTSSTAPASFLWNTASSANGTYILTARAYDAGGNLGVSTAVTVTVRNIVADTTPPSVSITSPVNGSQVTKSVKVSTYASDNVGVTRVDLLVDGRLYASNSLIPASFTLNSSKLAKGAHTLQAIAYDAAANAGRSTLITVYR